jgi:two-component system response regulator FixJ
MTSRIVHVLDDDAAVLKSLDRLLRSAGLDTRLYRSPFELLAAVPDSGCVLLDVKMPGMDGLEVQQRLASFGIPVILMTGHGDIDMAIGAIKSGAADFLEKPFSDDRLFAALEAALDKEIAPTSAERAREAAAKLAELSPREREVLDGLANGEAHKAIAHRLTISVRTVELHRTRMLHRLGTRHLADAIRLAVLAELASEAPPSRMELPIQ